jgi:heme/copper-type cytochrome/quinol oxidase subunit 3
MLALPPGPTPAPRRNLFVSTAFFCATGALFIGGLMAVWLRFRAAAPVRPGEPGERDFIKDWMPADIIVPEVAANMFPIALVVAAIMAQWAVYAGVRQIRTHTGMALGMTFLMGLAAINAQVFIWNEMGVGVRDHAFGALFYAVTVSLALLLVGGLVYTAVTAFRYLGGRQGETDLLTAHAMYWYFLVAATTVVWFVVYVQK